MIAEPLPRQRRAYRAFDKISPCRPRRHRRQQAAGGNIGADPDEQHRRGGPCRRDQRDARLL